MRARTMDIRLKITISPWRNRKPSPIWALAHEEEISHAPLFASRRRLVELGHRQC